MRYIKTFEQVDDQLFKTWKKDSVIGKYVIMKYDFDRGDREFRNFLNTNIAQIIDVPENGYVKLRYDKQNIPMRLLSQFQNENKFYNCKYILKISSDKEELEQFLVTQKYNL